MNLIQSHNLRRKRGDKARPLVHHPQALVPQTLQGQERERERSSPQGDQERRGEIPPPLAPPIPQIENLRDVHQDLNLDPVVPQVIDLQSEPHCPGQDHQDLAQSRQDATQDLIHLGVIEEVTDTPGPRRDLQGQSGEGQDLRHHVATDLLLEDTEVEVDLLRPDIDLTQDLDLALHVTGLLHPSLVDTVIAQRQEVPLRHLIQRGPGLLSPDTEAMQGTLVIRNNRRETHFKTGETCFI